MTYKFNTIKIKQNILGGMTREQKLQFCISKAREAFISHFPEIEFGIIFPMLDTEKDVTMWVRKMEERYYFKVSVQEILICACHQLFNIW